MKIKCPECGRDLYTNPFGLNRELFCPYCNTMLKRDAESSRFLKLYFVFETVLVIPLIILFGFVLHRRVVSTVLFVYLLSDYILEIPERYMYHSGILEYRKENDPKSDEN